MRILLYIATIVSIITYLFWSYLPKGSFYIGNGFFIFLLCVYLFFTDKTSSIKFILFSLALNNLLDELFFDNTKFGINEILIGIAVIVFAILKYRNDRKRPTNPRAADDVLL